MEELLNESQQALNNPILSSTTDAGEILWSAANVVIVRYEGEEYEVRIMCKSGETGEKGQSR